MIRLFIALRPPASIRERLLDLMDGVAEARWQDEHQLHLTLRFVGEVERPTAEELAGVFQRFRAPAPEVRLQGVGMFGGRGRAGALWAGLIPREPLTALHRKADQLCVRLGLEAERRSFTPHITVARLSRGSAHGGSEVERWRAAHAALTSEPFRFDHAILYRSRLSRAGASYEAVVEVKLVEAPGRP